MEQSHPLLAPKPVRPSRLVQRPVTPPQRSYPPPSKPIDPPPYLFPQQDYSNLRVKVDRTRSNSEQHRSKAGSTYQSFSVGVPDVPKVRLRTQSAVSRASSRPTGREIDPRTREDAISESGMSIASTFNPTHRPRDSDAKAKLAAQTNSPLRVWARWMRKSGKDKWSLPVAIAVVLWVKWTISLGSYSGSWLDLSFSKLT